MPLVTAVLLPDPPRSTTLRPLPLNSLLRLIRAATPGSRRCLNSVTFPRFLQPHSWSFDVTLGCITESEHSQVPYNHMGQGEKNPLATWHLEQLSARVVFLLCWFLFEAVRCWLVFRTSAAKHDCLQTCDCTGSRLPKPVPRFLWWGKSTGSIYSH